MTDHIEQARRRSVSAHQDWAKAASSNDLPESTKDALRQRGNDVWDEAVESLRLAGVYALIDTPEEQRRNQFDSECASLRDPSFLDLDLKPLDRMHHRWQLIKFANRFALAALLLAAGYFAGYSSGEHITDADLTALHSIESQQLQGAAK